jgi:hypothetical protein
MSLYERLKVLAARFDALNLEYEQLNRSLREVVLEAEIEKGKRSRKYRLFRTYVTRFKNFQK